MSEQLSGDLPSQEQRRMLFVALNPVAGLVNFARTSLRIQDWCEQHGWACEIYETSEDEDLTAPIHEAFAHGCQAVIAAGGDGTVSCVAAGMVSSDVPMVILPLGTGNLLAWNLGIPSDMNRALGVLENESTSIYLDMMTVNGHSSVLNAGVGFSSQLIKNTPREAKRRFGFLAYLKSAVLAVFGLQPHAFRLSVDGKKFKIRASEIYIANGGLMGLQIPFEGVHVNPDDGRIDIFVIKARTLWDYLGLLYYILRRKPRRARKMFYIQAADTVVIESETILPAQSDGEMVGETPVHIQVIPGAVKLLLPVKQDDALFSILRQIVGM